jgi:hypothetical protein
VKSAELIIEDISKEVGPTSAEDKIQKDELSNRSIISHSLSV